MPAGATGDLGYFLNRQIAIPVPVELDMTPERNMVDIHIEPHADRIGRDQEIDLSRLVHGDLRIARARA